MNARKEHEADARPQSGIAPSTAIFSVERKAHVRTVERAYCKSRTTSKSNRRQARMQPARHMRLCLTRTGLLTACEPTCGDRDSRQHPNLEGRLKPNVTSYGTSRTKSHGPLHFSGVLHSSDNFKTKGPIQSSIGQSVISVRKKPLSRTQGTAPCRSMQNASKMEQDMRIGARGAKGAASHFRNAQTQGIRIRAGLGDCKSPLLPARR